MTLEQLKEKYGNTIGGYEFLSDVEKYGEGVRKEIGAEILRRVEGENDEPKGTACWLHVETTIDTIKQHIKDVTK